MSDVVPTSRFHRFWSTRPITLVLIGVIIALHAGVRLKTTPNPDREAAYRDLGLLQIQHSSEHPELFGPFDLWAGEWWRIPLGGLHHAGWCHLALGALALLYLGGLLESKISAANYLGFLLGALFVTTIPRWLAEGTVPIWFIGKQPMTGISGVVFAQFGALLLLRRNDRLLTRRFGEGGILLGIAVGLGCLAFATVPLIEVNVDNLAHLAGLPYGLLWGLILSAPRMARRFLVPVFLGAHLLMWPLFEGLMHPSQNGRYHWWQAEQTEDADLKKVCYQTALQQDPNLEYPWLALAELEFQNDQPSEAWRTLVNGLEQHRELENSETLSRRIWSEFPTAADRRGAWREAEQTLAEDSQDWSARLLSPHQAAAFHMEEEEPLKAWFFLMRQLRGQPAPQAKFDLGEDLELAESIWRNLPTTAERQAALNIMDEQLELHRRAWQLAIIPNRDLIPHYQHLGEAMWAWQSLMEELRDDPDFHPAGKRIAEEIWRMFPTDLRRRRARKIVEDVFGREGLHWQIELGILSDAVKHRYRLDQAVRLPAEPLDGPPTASTPIPLNPDDPASAAFGTKL